MVNIKIKNKGRVGRGSRGRFANRNIFANTRHLNRILLCLSSEDKYWRLMDIQDFTIMPIPKMKDGLTFLVKLEIIKKFNLNNNKTSSYTYKINKKYILDEVNENV